MADRQQKPPLGLVLSLVATVAFALAGLFLVRGLAPAAWMQANNEVAGNYLQTIGTIYAVLLAFVVFVVWQQHNDFRGAVDEEANDLSDLGRLLQAFPEPDRSRVIRRIYTYRRAVVDDEWATMSAGRSSDQAGQALEEIWQALAGFVPKTDREAVLYDQALDRFNELSDVRTRRLWCSRLRLPPTLWALLFTNGGLVVGSMWLFGLDSLAAHALMTVGLAVSIAFILYLIADLDNPFWGAWQVRADAFRRALSQPSPGDAGGSAELAGNPDRMPSTPAARPAGSAHPAAGSTPDPPSAGSLSASRED